MRQVTKQLIQDFLVQIKGAAPELIVWPEEMPGAPDKEIDARAKVGNDMLALEHTSVDVLPNQRQQGQIIRTNYAPVFQRLLSLAKSEQKHIRLILPSDTLAVPGVNWNEAARVLENELTRIVPSLPAKQQDQLKEVEMNVEGKQVSAVVRYSQSKGHGTFIPSWSYNPEEAADFGKRFRQTVTDNLNKLQKYASDRTVLLIENDDISLFNSALLTNNITQGLLPAWFYEMWYVDMSIPTQPMVMRLYPEPHDEYELTTKQRHTFQS